MMADGGVPNNRDNQPEKGVKTEANKTHIDDRPNGVDNILFAHANGFWVIMVYKETSPLPHLKWNK